MRDFMETPGANVPDVEKTYPPTVWLSADDAMVYDKLICYGANYGHTKWGDKVFLLVSIAGDPEATQYTVSFTERSAVYAKMRPIVDQHDTSKDIAEVSSPFPFACSIAPLGKTYTITGARKTDPRKARPPLPVRPDSTPIDAESISPF